MRPFHTLTRAVQARSTRYLGALLLVASFSAQAQTGGVGIGTTTPAASAALDITSTSKGVLLPRMTQAQRNAIASPAVGLTIYNTDTNALNVWNGTSWGEALTSGTQPAVQNAPVTFGYTGGVQTYTVPANVYSLGVDASGAQGGKNYGGLAGAQGGHVVTTLAVTPGETLTLYVGGQGSMAPYPGSGGAGYNGGGQGTSYNGGGGGATDVRRSATVPSTSLADRLVVAGGGGGASSGNSGGGGGGLSGDAGPDGLGGTQTAGGAGGNGVGTGSLGQGGTGSYTGGGGGYYGGGGGYSGGGGGGSGYVAASGTSNTSMTTGTQAGNGSLTLIPGAVYATPAISGVNFVNVPGTWSVSGTTYYYNNGSVGIGTASPSQTLDVAGNTNVSGNTTVGGNVGIGTTTPGQKLDVAGNANISGNGYVSGNVGIGTTTPSQKLDVTGNANVSGNTTVGGSVGIGTTTPATSAALDVSSTSQGLLPPRMTQAQRNAIASPAAGLTIYNMTTGKLNTWNGTNWDEALTAYQQSFSGSATTFSYTGAAQTYTVPAGVFSLSVDAAGAQGGSNGGRSAGGNGARVQATLAVTPGEVLTIYVGGAGSPSPNAPGGAGYNGGGNGVYSQGRQSGGGGGASDVRRSATAPSTALADRLLVAAGGGGGGYDPGYGGTSLGGAGGAPSGGTGGINEPGVIAGTGATTSAGGNVNGALGQGGNAPATNPGGTANLGGGGGGGYYGGGGAPSSGGGGGGSSYVQASSSSAVTMTDAYQTGNGYVTVALYVAPALSGANFVDVPGTWSVSGANVYRASGNVGIGTTTPGQKLDVAGNANVSGNATVSSLLTAGSATINGATTITGATTVAGTTTVTGATAINTSGSASTRLGSATGAVILPGLSTAGFVTNSASGQLGTTTAASLGTNFILNQSSQQTGATFNVSGNGTVGGAFTAGSAAITNNATVGGSLGVGTSSPAGQLANTAVNVIATDGNGISQQGLGWVNTNSLGYAGVFYNANFLQSSPGLAVKIANPNSPALDVSQGGATTAGASLLRVNGNGTVGVGTSSPAGGLHVATGNSGPGTGAGTAGAVLSGAPGQPPYLELRGSGTGTSTTTPYIDFAEASDQDFTTRLISQAGVLTVNGNGNAGLLMQVNGGLRATSYANISDARFKTNIRPIGSALASVLALRGVRYEWNALGIRHGGTAGASQVGVLAQEVEKIYPELVSTDKDGYKAVNYAQLTPVLIEALKEQQTQIEALKQQAAAANTRAATAETKAVQATATLETFEARLRRLEAGSAQAQR